MSTCKNNSNINPNAVPSTKLVEVRGKKGELTIKRTEEGNAVVFTAEFYKEFDISLEAQPAIVEVGSSDVEVAFTGKITRKDTDIASRSLTPSVSGLDPLEVDSFTFTKTGIESDIQGIYPAHVLEVTDKAGTKKNVTGGTRFYHRVYQGFSSLEELTENDIKNLENSNVEESVFTSYGGNQTYSVPVSSLKQYIYWVFHKDTAPIIAARTGLLTFPLTKLDNVTIESDVKPGLMLEMQVFRSANKFGNGDMQIDLLKTLDEFELDDIEFITAN